EKKHRVREDEEQRPTRRMEHGCRTMTRRLPAWVEERAGRPVLIPDRAAVVRRIFKLSAEGCGAALIVKRLTEDHWPAFGGRGAYIDGDGRERSRAPPGEVLGAGHWTRSYVGLILKDRRALGEFQPRKRDGSPEGEPVPNYYPPAVTEEEYYAAR